MGKTLEQKIVEIYTKARGRIQELKRQKMDLIKHRVKTEEFSLIEQIRKRLGI